VGLLTQGPTFTGESMSTKQTIDMTNFDFGFTAMTEDELSVVQESKAQVEASSATAESAAAKAQIMYEAVIPLLNNLKANPEKDYIYWPNRYEKLDAFADQLHQILSGE
jgi:hypothetical protein